jgi:hypothetical protein
MKKLSLALLALAMALMIAPAARADSFNYTINGANFSADLTFTTGTGTVSVPGPNSAVDINAYIVTAVSGTFDIIGEPSSTFPTTPTEPANSGAYAYNLTTSSDGKFIFDNLLYPENAGIGTSNGIMDSGGILVKFSNGYEYELNLFSGSFGTSSAGDRYFYFADNGTYYSNNPVTDGNNGPAPDDLTPAPEPGSMLLLGTGLLGLALVLSRKTAKRSSQPVSNA